MLYEVITIMSLLCLDLPGKTIFFQLFRSTIREQQGCQLIQRLPVNTAFECHDFLQRLPVIHPAPVIELP